MERNRVNILEDLLLINDLKYMLIEVQNIFPSVRTFFKGLATSQELQKLQSSLNTLLKSKNALKEFKNSVIIQAFVSKLTKRDVENRSFKETEVGIVEKLNSNTANLVPVEFMMDQETIFEATSGVLCASCNVSALLKLFVLNRLIRDFVKFRKLAEENDIDLCSVFEDVRNETKIPSPFTVSLLSQVLEKNIFIHMASHNLEDLTFEFSDKRWKKSLHVMYNNDRFHGLFEARRNRKRLRTVLPKYSWGQNVSNVMSSSIVSEAAKALSVRCSFCDKFFVEACPHILPCHTQGYNLLQQLIPDFAVFNASAVCSERVKKSFQLPVSVSNCIVVDISRYENAGDSLFCSVSFHITGSEDLVTALRKSVAVEFMQHEHLYRLWFESEGWDVVSFKEFRESVLSTDRYCSPKISAILSRVLRRPILQFSTSSNAIPRLYSLTEHTLNSHPICLLYLQTDHFQPIIPTCWDNFSIPAVFDVLGRSRNEVFLNSFEEYVPEKCEITNGRIVPFTGQQIPREEVDKYAKALKQHQLPKCKRKTILELFTSKIESELMEYGKLNELGINKFLQRTSSVKGFWIPYIKATGDKKSTEDMERKGKCLARYQETVAGRQRVAELFAKYHISQKVIDIYIDKAKDKFKNILHGKFDESNRQGGKRCTIPTYDSCDLEMDYPSSNEFTCNSGNQSDNETLNEISMDVDSHFGTLSPNAIEHNMQYDSHPRFVPTWSPAIEHQVEVDSNGIFTSGESPPLQDTWIINEDHDNSNSATESPTSGQASKTSSILDKEEMAKALGIKVRESHGLREPFELTINSAKVEKEYNFSNEQFKSAGMANVLNKEIANKTGCSFNNRRPPFYYSSKRKLRRKRKQSKFCKFDGYCGCGLKMHVFIPSAPQKGQDLRCQVVPLGKTKLLQTKSTSRQVRGDARMELAQKLEHVKPTKFMLTEASQLSETRLLHGNNVVASIHVPRTVRSQALKKLVYSDDVEEDLKQLRKEFVEKYGNDKRIKGFIQRATFDNNCVSVTLYDEASLTLLMNASKHEDFELHVDATGSVCQKENGKEILYFLLLASSNDYGSYPVAHLLSQKNRASDLAQFFIKLSADMVEIRPSFKRAIAPVLVTDMSLPIIMGALQGLNKQSLGDYLLTCFNVLNHKYPFQTDRVLITLCSNHLIKAMSRNLSKFLTATRHDKAVRNLSLHALVKIQECENLKDIASVYKIVIEFFSENKLDPRKVDSYKQFLLNSNWDGMEQLQETVSTVWLDQIQDSMPTELRASSPFFKLFEAIEGNVKKQATYDANQYYNDRVLHLFKHQYVPFTPLFCAAMIKYTQRSSFNRLSNAVIESEFNTIKGNFHPKARQSIGLFIRSHQLYHEGKLKSLLLKPTKRKARKCRSRTTKQHSSQNEERWSRRSKARKPKYFSARKRLSPKAKKRVDDILQNEIFTIASEILAQNIIQPINNQTEVSDNVTATSQTDVQRKKTKMTLEEMNTGFDHANVCNEETRNRLIQNWMDIDVVDEFKEKRLGLMADINRTIGATDNEILKEKIRKRNKAKMFKKQTAVHPAEAQKKKKLDEPDNIVMRYRGAPPCSNPGEILCQVQSHLPILDSTLAKQQLADFVNEGVCIEGDHIDFYLSLQKFRNPGSKYMVSAFAFCHKYSYTSKGIELQKWNYDPRAQTDDPVNAMFVGQDERKILHYATLQYLIHPLLDNDHWRLLVMDFNKKKCTILDSLIPSMTGQEEKIKEYKQFVIPKFLKRSQAKEAEKWDVSFCHDMRQQADVKSCGLFAMAAARELLVQDDTKAINEAIINIEPPIFERRKMLFEMLSSSPEGRELLEIKNRNYMDIKAYLEK